MNSSDIGAPQRQLLFRILSFLTRFQLRSLLKNMSHSQAYAVGYAGLAGGISLGTITLGAFITDLPLLFPPLAPSAFILFYTPMSEQASPRNVLLSHGLGVASGLVALHLISAILPQAELLDPAVMSWGRVATIALAMGLITALMSGLRCAHPPAAASSLLAAMGYLEHPLQSVGLLGATVLLVLEAIFLNRVMGGLPYPWWRADPRIIQSFGGLSGLPGPHDNHWSTMAERILSRR
ncbi:MAG: HPP family protein [bacterium]